MKQENHPHASLSENLTVKEEDAGRRLDLFLSDRVAELSRNRVQKLVDAGMVLINQVACLDKNYRLQTGDLVILTIPPPAEATVASEEIKLDVDRKSVV